MKNKKRSVLTYKYRIYAKNYVISRAEMWLHLCCDLYNMALEQRIWAWKRCRKSVTYNEQQKELTELRQYFDSYRLVSQRVERDVLRKLDQSYKYFYSGIKKGIKVGYPRFKSYRRYNSFTLRDGYWKINNDRLYINNIGEFKIKLSRLIIGNIKYITIKRDNLNKWYACIAIENIPKKVIPYTDRVIGLDVGINSYITDSSGDKISNPKFSGKILDKIRINNRKLSRAKVGSNRRKKVKRQLLKCYEKVKNQRNDFLQKLSTSYINNYKCIAIEDLTINNMCRNNKLSSCINDCAWDRFFTMLSYKAEEADRILVKVNPRNTSKKCNKCGSINHELKLSDRIWICENCGTTHDRDENAAINIKRLGQSHQSLTCTVT